MDEDVRFSIGIVIHQITGLGLESHISAISTDAGTEAVAIWLKITGANTDPFSSARLTVMDKGISSFIGIIINQVIGIGDKSHIPTVWTNGGHCIYTISLATKAISANSFNKICLSIMDEDVRLSIGIVIHQVAGLWSESHIAAISTNVRPVTVSTSRLTITAVDVNPFSKTCLSIMDEDVRLSISIVIHQVAGRWSENYILAVSTDAGIEAFAIWLKTTGANTDPRNLRVWEGKLTCCCYRWIACLISSIQHIHAVVFCHIGYSRQFIFQGLEFQINAGSIDIVESISGSLNRKSTHLAQDIADVTQSRFSGS